LLRSEKEGLVASLHETFQNAQLVVVTHYRGLTVSEITDLRQRMREAQAGFKVTKNRLTRIALEGTDFEPIGELFTGPTAIAYSADPVAAAKVAWDFAKENGKLEILGGAMGTQALDKAGVESVAQMPSLDELRAKLARLLTTPAQRLATVTQEPAGSLARVLKARGEQEAA